LAKYQASFEELEEEEGGEERELYLNEALREVEQGPPTTCLVKILYGLCGWILDCV